MNRIAFSFVGLLALAAACLSRPAQAEYRCADPQLPADVRACALARQGPDQLRRFVESTRAIYHLNFYDYVTEADFARWEAEREAAAVALARGENVANRPGKTDKE